MAASTRRLRRTGDDAGTTLIEMSVVLLLLSIVLPIIALLLQGMQTDSNTVASRAVANGQALVIDEALSRQIHAANYPTGASKGQGGELVTADANEIKFYSSLGDANGPRLIDIYTSLACTGCTYYNLDESYIIPGGTPTSPTYTSSPVVHILGTGLVVPSTFATGCPTSGSQVPIFEYLNSSGGCLQVTTPTDNISGANPPMALNASVFSSVESVNVTLTTLDTLHPTTAVEPVSTFNISLPNVDYANG